MSYKSALLTGYISACLMLAATPANAQFHAGTLSDHTFFSKALQKDMVCRVYLPPGYQNQASAPRYPVIYSLHGASVGYEAYDLMYPLVDALWLTGSVKHFILVMPDGQAEPFQGSFYSNSSLYGNYEDYIAEDLITFIDENFRTLAEPSYRAIMGHSMGSYGAFKIALKHPELFIGVAGHSGPLNIEMLDLLIPDLKAENGQNPPFNWAPGAGKSLTNLAFSMAGAFSPNPAAEHLVDFPLDQNGELIADVMNRWKDHNIARMAQSFAKPQAIGIYFDCGNQDNYKLQFHNRALSDSLRAYGIVHQYVEYPGDHNSGLPFRVPVAIRFLDRLFGTPTATENLTMSQKTFSLVSNPVYDFIEIRSVEPLFSGEPSEPIVITLISAAGQAVHQSVASTWPLMIDAKSLRTGLYFLHIRQKDRIETLKVVIGQGSF